MARNGYMPVQPRLTPGSELLKHVRRVVLSGRSAITPGHRVHHVYGSGRNVPTNRCVYRRKCRMSNGAVIEFLETRFQLINRQI